MKPRLAEIVALAVVAGLLLAACGGHDQKDNANEFRERIQEARFAVDLEPEVEGRPGLVAGVAALDEEIQSRFYMSFGPAPEELVPEILDREGAVWFNAGDQVYFWVESEPPGLPKKLADEALEMKFKIEDTACQVVADRDCGI